MNLENTCYIVGAASLEGVRLSPCAGDYIIAADGGYRSLRARGIEPDFVMGDFDSLGYRPDHPNVETHPVMKDDTDLGLAVRWALGHGYRRLVMAGALGGRIDQTIASLQTLRGLTDAGAQGWLIGCGADDWAGGSSRYILSESSSSQSGLIRGNLRRIFCSRSKPGLFRPARIWEIPAGLIPSSSASWLGFNPSFFIKSSNFSLICRIFYKYKYLFFVKQVSLSFVKC